jgi:glyoxylase-like metal-dependent hydrolase (beta-lactamase superfamily II)
MYFRMLLDEPTGAVSYLLADLDAAEAALVDARAADLPVLHALLAEHGLRLRWLLRTHAHAATTSSGDDAALQQALGGQAICRTPPAPAADGRALLPLGHQHLQVLATPGHTPHCLSYLWRDRLFCGGLLAVDACPVQPRPAQPEALWHSVTRQVFTLPAETLLFAGHAHQGRAVSSVLEQRRWHPWFAGLTRDGFLAQITELAAGDPSGLPGSRPLLP